MSIYLCEDFTKEELCNGAHDVIFMSYMAYKFYITRETIYIYKRDGKYYVRGFYGDYNDLSFEEVERLFERFADGVC
ncbi:MAG: hypothetical protein IJM37_10490 [Lachnospiraceae bacterium]|nr:hypothetical protein [Lachnospiraceae bacterium]